MEDNGHTKDEFMEEEVRVDSQTGFDEEPRYSNREFTYASRIARALTKTKGELR